MVTVINICFWSFLSCKHSRYYMHAWDASETPLSICTSSRIKIYNMLITWSTFNLVPWTLYGPTLSRLKHNLHYLFYYFRAQWSSVLLGSLIFCGNPTHQLGSNNLHHCKDWLVSCSRYVTLTQLRCSALCTVSISASISPYIA